MKRLLTLAVLSLMAGTVVAGGIAGQITDAATGGPIEGAVVIARGGSGAGRATTNAHGAYLIENLAPGSYQVQATARGYYPNSTPRPVPVRGEEITRGVDLALQPRQGQEPGAIAGRVVDRRTGEPIENAIVVATGPAGHGRARTGEGGHYAIRGLQSGTYRVRAKARHYDKQIYPRAVPVRSGEATRPVDFALVPRPRRGALSGRVVDARTHRPIAGAVVVVRGEHGQYRAQTDRQGCYKVRGVSPGAYRVTAMKRGYRPQTFPRPVPVHPGQVTRDVNFALRPLRADSY